MAIKGSLKEASLADVCQLLALGQKTGCLSVTDRANFGQIFFDDGHVTYARIVNRRDRLGDLLIRDGRIDRGRLDQAVAEQARDQDRRLGEILVRNGWLSEDELRHYIAIQVEEAIYLLFTWSRGTFFFEVDQRPDDAEMLVRLNPEGLLLEGARRVDEWELIAKKIPSFDLVFQIDSDRLEQADVQLTEEQERVIALLDGSRTVQEVADATGLVEFDAGKALFGLVQAGFAHQVGRRAVEPVDRVRPGDADEYRNLGIAFYRTGLLAEAKREFRRVLEIRPEDRSAIFHLSLVALREDRPDEAIERIRALLQHGGARFPALMNLAFALRRAGRIDEALQALDAVESERPGEAAVAFARGRVLLDGRRPERAAEAFAEYRDRLPAGEPPSPAACHYEILAAALAGREAEARELAERALELHPASAPLRIVIGVLAEGRGDLDTAESNYRRAAEEDPGLPQAHKNLGDIAYRRGLYEDAAEHYRRAVDLAPDLGDDVYARLGNIDFRRSEREAALRYWRRALEMNPENQVVRNNIEIAAGAAG